MALPLKRSSHAVRYLRHLTMFDTFSETFGVREQSESQGDWKRSLDLLGMERSQQLEFSALRWN